MIVVCSSSQYLFDAICAAGGDSMRASFDAESDKKPTDSVISVRAEGQLKSKAVYFLPWQADSDDSVLRQSIKTFVANAVKRASSDGYRSIAFPAIGCGLLGCSTSLVAQVMVKKAHKLSDKHNISVMFVIQPHKTDVYDEFRKQIESVQHSAASARLQKATSVSVNRGIIEVEMGDIIVQAVYTKRLFWSHVNNFCLCISQVDVIIVSIASQYLRDAVISAAGDQIRKAYKTEFEKNPHSILISTPSGELPSKRIFFVKWQPDTDAARLRQSLVDLIWIVIQNVMGHNFTSLAFPAIGCGKYACSVEIVVRTLVMEMKNQLNMRDLPLTVKFVIENGQKSIYNEFCEQILAAQEGMILLLSLLLVVWKFGIKSVGLDRDILRVCMAISIFLRKIVHRIFPVRK